MELYRGAIEIRVDWADNGIFGLSDDVTVDVRSLGVLFGTNVTASPQRPTLRSAQGRLVLSGTRYIARGGGSLNDAVLFRRHRVRMRIDGEVFWTGWIHSPKQNAVETGLPETSWTLEGLLSQRRNDRVYVTQPNDSANSIDPEVLATWAATVGAAPPNLIEITSTTIGVYSYTGAAGQYLRDFCLVAGGVPIERADGTIAIASPTANPPGQAELRSHELVVERAVVTEAVDHLRNALVLDQTDVAVDTIVETEPETLIWDAGETVIAREIGAELLRDTAPLTLGGAYTISELVVDQIEGWVQTVSGAGGGGLVDTFAWVSTFEGVNGFEASEVLVNSPGGGVDGIGISIPPDAFDTEFNHEYRVYSGLDTLHPPGAQNVNLSGRGNTFLVTGLPVLSGTDEYRSVAIESAALNGLVTVSDSYTIQTSGAPTTTTLTWSPTGTGGATRGWTVPAGSFGVTASLNSYTGRTLISPGYFSWNGVVGTGSVVTVIQPAFASYAVNSVPSYNAYIIGTTLTGVIIFSGTVTYNYRAAVSDTRPGAPAHAQVLDAATSYTSTPSGAYSASLSVSYQQPGATQTRTIPAVTGYRPVNDPPPPVTAIEVLNPRGGAGSLRVFAALAGSITYSKRSANATGTALLPAAQVTVSSATNYLASLRVTYQRVTPGTGTPMVQVTSEISAATQYRLTFRLRVTIDYPEAAAQVRVENAASVAEWGRREVTYPRWFRRGASDGAQERVDALAVPRQFVTLTLPLWQKSAAQADQVRDWEPGDFLACSVRDSATSVNVQAHCLIMSTAYEWHDGRTPRKIFYMLETGHQLVSNAFTFDEANFAIGARLR